MAQPGQPVGGNNEQKFNWTRLIIWFVVIAAVVLLLLYMFGVFNKGENVLDISKLLANGVVFDKISTNEAAHKVFITYTDAQGVIHSGVIYETTGFIDALSTGNVPPGNTGLLKTLVDAIQNNKNIWKGDVAVNTGGGSIWISLLISLLPMLIFIGLMIWIFKRSSGGGMGEAFGGGKNQAKRVSSDKRFSDVAGQVEAKEEVAEVVDFLKRPAKYKAAGARVPKGIMLGGPPGTGKTLIAKAVAGEAKVPFFFISASNFVEMFAGLGAKRVREMFKEARKAAPAILFIDEMDAVGRKRGSSLSGNDEREQTLNQVLVEMDGMDENSGLLVMAATNRPDVLDPALLRPGRFDRVITIGLPDIKEREAILTLHAKGKRISDEIDFKNIAKRTPRYSGAQLENVINEAALLSVRESTGVITLAQIDEAIDRVQAGPAKKHRVITEAENKRVAYHEAGHAVIGLKVDGADIVQKITIIPRGDAGGYTLMTPKEELYNYSRSQLEAKIVSYMGGRAAEQIMYGIGEVSTGASNDIEMATAYARAMVTQYGMSILGPIAYERAQGSQYLGQEKVKEYSDALAERIDEAIRDIIIAAEEKAIVTIKKNKKLLELIAAELVDNETIVLEEINYINEHLTRLPKREEKSKPVAQKKTLDEIIKDVQSKKTKKDVVEETKEKVEETTPSKVEKVSEEVEKTSSEKEEVAKTESDDIEAKK